MPQNLHTSNGHTYLPAGDVGKQFGYTRDYILLLAREGKILANKVGGRWYVDEESVKIFFEESKSLQEERRKKLKEERKAEFRKSEIVFKQEKSTALSETIAIACIGIVIGTTGYIGVRIQEHSAFVNESGFGFFRSFARSVYLGFAGDQSNDSSIVKQEASLAVSLPEGSVISASSSTKNVRDAYTPSLVIAPEHEMSTTTIEDIQNSFSDEVTVEFDAEGSDTGVIIPHFKERDGEAYRFLVVPVNSDKAP